MLPHAGLGVVGAPAATGAARRLGRDELDTLVALGRRNPTGRWTIGADLADARNMHATNRRSELRRALTGDYDWLEVDIRRIGGTLVASHDRIPARDALLMRDWIAIGSATGRGLKLDFKEREAITPTLDLVADAGIPDELLVINVPVLGRGGVSLDQLLRIRERLPNATINLSLRGSGWNGRAARAIVELARRVGGPIAFPVELSSIDARLVAALRRGGRIAVWNDPKRSPVSDRDVARRRLRALGVDGTIDLR